MPETAPEGALHTVPRTEIPRLVDCRVIGLINGCELFGQEKANIEVFKVLRAQGAEVHVGVNALNRGGAVGSSLRSLGISTFEVPFGCQWSKTFIKAQPSLVFTHCGQVARSSTLLYRKIRSMHPTHIHVGNALAYSYVAPALALMRTPLIFRAGDEPPRDSLPNLCIWKSCFRRAHHVVAISEYIRSNIHNGFPTERRIDVIYSAATSIGKSVGSFRKDSQKRLLYIGQISPEKGLDDFVSAAIAISKSRSDVIFNIVGASAYTTLYEAKLKERVVAAGLPNRILFHGYVADPVEFYESSFAMVVPSRLKEAAGNVVIEGKKLGVPAVVYPTGGLPELARHMVDGYVCRDKSIESLMEGINWFLDDPHRREVASTAAREDYESRFGWERFAAQWAEIYCRKFR